MAEETVLKAVRSVIASNGVPYLQISAGSYSGSGREKDRKSRIMLLGS